MTPVLTHTSQPTITNVCSLANAVNSSLKITSGIAHLVSRPPRVAESPSNLTDDQYDMNYLYGFVSAVFVYWALSYCFPAQESLLEACIYEDPDVINSVDFTKKSEQDSNDTVSAGEKGRFATISGQV